VRSPPPSAPAPEIVVAPRPPPAPRPAVGEEPASPPFAEPFPPAFAETLLPLPPPAHDIWVRIRKGFAMPDLEDPLVTKWEEWYAARPDYVARMVDRSRRYLYHIVIEVELRGMPTEIAPSDGQKAQPEDLRCRRTSLRSVVHPLYRRTTE
jgi:membrane-bound lytic murein transglycosylase D